MVMKKRPRPNVRRREERTGNEGLRQGLGFGAAFSIVVGMVIGSGIFFKPGIVLRDTGSVWMSVLA